MLTRLMYCSIALGALVWIAGCSLFPAPGPIYVPAVAPPLWQDVAAVRPSLPGGRPAIIDRFAHATHVSTVRSALLDGLAVAPAPAQHALTHFSRLGSFELRDGRRFFYWINKVRNDQEVVVLRFPDRRLLALELPAPEYEEDEPD
ncbi:MAG: hypothetical protein AB8B93_11200 [Pseudomonadales bacterium]